MTALTREAILTALYGLITPLVVANNASPTTGQPFRYSSRRMQLWSDVPAANKPAIFLSEGPENDEREELSEPNQQRLSAFIWIYTDVGKDESIVPATVMNNLIDTVRTAIKPSPLTGVQTLGNLVIDVSVIGKTLKDPGDLDGNGVARIPLRIIVPSF